MNDSKQKSWLTRKAEAALKSGFTRAYETVKVNPQEYLVHLRAAHGLPINTYQGVFSVPMDELDEIAADTIRGSMKIAAAEGAGFGLGGVLTLVPDLGVLAAITMRMIQKLSLIYGFEYNTDDEIAELWIATASAAGVDISRELVERSVVRQFVPRVISRIATQASGEVVEKWAGRVIPVLSSVIGGALNYIFIRAWSERAARHFREKHLALRAKMVEAGQVPLLET
ncbi:MAG TPA: EcsC family protein [Terriglobales bacterium]|nr:EcsC family protein [Terriglobales bacterium]